MHHSAPALPRRGLPRLPGIGLLTIMVTAVMLTFATESRAAIAAKNDPREDAADRAVRALAPYVSRTSHPQALRMAFQAYYNYLSARTDQVKNPYFYFVDLGLDNRTPRGYVFDMNSLDRKSVV